MADSAPNVIRLSLAIRRASFATRALLLLGVLVLGAALHGLHHLQDPGCADGVERGHACTVCASLHGSALAATESDAPRPVATVWSHAVTGTLAAPVPAPRSLAAPRAPPAS